MKGQIFYLNNLKAIYFIAIMLGIAILFPGCESQLDEVQPASKIEISETDASRRGGMKDMPHKELAALRAAVARYHKIEHAIADGYDLEFTGYRSMMGFHYMKATLLDGNFDVERPEVLIYVPAPNNKLRFVGVEYAVPIADMNNIPPAPEGFSGDHDQWAVNTEFKVWTLHVWVGLDNPRGIFAPRNPRLP